MAMMAFLSSRIEVPSRPRELHGLSQCDITPPLACVIGHSSKFSLLTDYSFDNFPDDDPARSTLNLLNSKVNSCNRSPNLRFFRIFYANVVVP